MTEWIANGESGASVRAKLNTIPNDGAAALNPGSVLLGRGEIATPTNFIEFDLPDEYDFLLQLRQFQTDAFDTFIIQTSEDGGAHYFTGGTDYEDMLIHPTGGTVSNSVFQDIGANVGAFDPGASPTQGCWADIRIDAGNANNKPFILSQNWYRIQNDNLMTLDWDANTVLAATTRQNKMKLSVYGNALKSFTSGYWLLYGFPLP